MAFLSRMKSVLCSLVRLTSLSLLWCHHSTDKLAKVTGYPVAYATVGLMSGGIILLCIGGMGLALMGTAVAVPIWVPLLFFVLLGSQIGQFRKFLSKWASTDRHESLNAVSYKTAAE